MSDGSVSTRFSVEDGASGPLEEIAAEAERVAQELDSAEAATAAANAALRTQKRAAEDAAFALKELSLSGKATKQEITAAKQASLDAAKALLQARRAADDANAGLKAVQAQAQGVAVELAAAAAEADRAAAAAAALAKAQEVEAQAARAAAEANEALAKAQAEAAEAAASQAAEQAARALAEAERKAAEEAERLAKAQAESAAAAAKHAAELEAIDPELRKLASAYKEQQAALQKEAQLLGVSTGEVRALRAEQAKLAASASKVAPALNDLDDVTRRTGDSTKRLAERAGTLDTSLKALAGVAGIVSPQLGALLTDSGDVLGGFEGLQRGAEALGVTLGGVGAAFAVASVAAAAGATAYSTYAVTQERAADASGRTAERLAEVRRVGDLAEATLRKLTTSGGAFGDILRDIADRSRVAAGELESVIAAEGAVRGIRAAVSPELLALGQKQASLSGQASAAQDRLQQAGAAGDEEGVVKAREEAQKLSAELAVVTDQLTKQKEAVERAIDTEEMLREKAQLEAEQREKDAEALRRGAEAANRRAEADRKAAQDAATRAAAEEAAHVAAVALTDAQRQLALNAYNTVAAIEALNPALTDADRAYRAQIAQIENLAASLGQAALAGDLLPEEFARLLGLIEDLRSKAESDLAAAQEAQTAPAATPEAAGGADRSDKIGAAVGGAVAGSLSQTLAPLLDALGPKGMIVSVILGILEQGPEAVKAILLGVPKILGDLVGTVLDLIPQLPTILTDVIMGIVKVIPDLLLAVFSLVYGPFVFELTAALVRLIPMLVKELTLGLFRLTAQLPSILFDTAGAFGNLLREIKNLPGVILRQWKNDLIPTLVDGIAKAFKQIIRDAVRSFSLDNRRERRSGGTDDGRRFVQWYERQVERRERRRA